MSYSKLFGSILDSTIWQQPDNVRLVWITMLAMKDRDGIVEASIPGLAKRASVSLEGTEAALEVLLAPDRYSRTPDYEGRRIEVVDGGWRVLNHEKYREKEALEERRRKDADRTARRRDRIKRDASGRTVTSPDLSRPVRTSPDASRGVRKVTPSDAEADTPDVRASGPDSGSGSGSGASGSGSGPRRDHEQAPPPVDRSGIRGSGHRVPPAPPIGAQELATPRQSAPTPQPLDPAAALRVRLVNAFLTRVNAERSRLAVEFGIQAPRSLPAMAGGESELVKRLKESADPAGDLDHVLAVAFAEARHRRELRWLGWSLAEEKAWRAKLQASVEEIERQPQQRGSAFDAIDEATAAITRRLDHREKPPTDPGES